MQSKLRDIHLRNAELTLRVIRFIAKQSSNSDYATWYDTIYRLSDAMIQSINEKEHHKTTLEELEDFLRIYAAFINSLEDEQNIYKN